MNKYIIVLLFLYISFVWSNPLSPDKKKASVM